MPPVNAFLRINPITYKYVYTGDLRNAIDAVRDMGSSAHPEEVLVIAHHYRHVAVRRSTSVRPDFSASSVHLHDILERRARMTSHEV
jgi:hypothetical protein